MKKYRVIIAGSRRFDDFTKLKTHCDNILRDKLDDDAVEVVVVSGGAKGADNLGEAYASERGLAVDCHPADWRKYGRSAGVLRNIEMADHADALIAFPQEGEENRGTNHMVRIAKNKGLAVTVVA